MSCLDDSPDQSAEPVLTDGSATRKTAAVRKMRAKVVQRVGSVKPRMDGDDDRRPADAAVRHGADGWLCKAGGDRSATKA